MFTPLAFFPRENTKAEGKKKKTGKMGRKNEIEK